MYYAELKGLLSVQRNFKGSMSQDVAVIIGNALAKEIIEARDGNESLLAKLNTLVDKIDGKGLSTEDFTTEEKEKLENTYTKDETDDLLEDKVDKVEGQGLSVVSNIIAMRNGEEMGHIDGDLILDDFYTPQIQDTSPINLTIKKYAENNATKTIELDIYDKEAINALLDKKVSEEQFFGLSSVRDIIMQEDFTDNPGMIFIDVIKHEGHLSTPQCNFYTAERVDIEISKAISQIRNDYNDIINANNEMLESRLNYTMDTKIAQAITQALNTEV